MHCDTHSVALMHSLRHKYSTRKLTRKPSSKAEAIAVSHSRFRDAAHLKRITILPDSLLQLTENTAYRKNNSKVIARARILMQKHIFSMWAESKDASKSEEFSMKGVSMQKL